MTRSSNPNITLLIAAIATAIFTTQLSTANAQEQPPATTETTAQPPATTPATTQPAPTYEVVEAITFVTRDGMPINLDMAYPTNITEPLPVIVALFGGGWISGSRTAMRDRIEFFAANGYIAVAPTYRLAPKDPFPAAIADVRECVRWLRRNADQYKIDPNHIGAVGYSAGGHLACMLGFTSADDSFGPDDKADDGVSSQVQAVVNFFGPGDMAHPDWSKLAISKYLAPFLGGTAEERPEQYRQASPITYISPGDPPILTFQGDLDRTVPLTIAQDLHRRLDKAKLTNKLVIVKGQGHGWGDPHKTQTRNQMLAFFDKYLRPSLTKEKAPMDTTQPMEKKPPMADTEKPADD